MTGEIGELLSAGVTTDVAVTITNASPSLELEFLILVVSGTIKFGKGSVNANAHGYAAGEKVIIRCNNGQLHAKQASAADTFVVTV